MKETRSQSHLIDVLFVLALFGVFIATALIVAVMGVSVYRNTVENMNKNFDTQTSLTYVSTKIRQSDVAGGVFLEELEGMPALVLERQEEGETYQTWIYHHNGYLQEFFVKKGSSIDPDFGVSIMPIDTFSVTEENGLFLISTTDRDGNPVSVMVSPRTM
ncbi:MAG: DUF4860 domain-containing protein [Clostridium sp.]|jgi:hypothetical protein|nr:DUF4860 domain-containing protein [Clostridium sp.]